MLPARQDRTPDQNGTGRDESDGRGGEPVNGGIVSGEQQSEPPYGWPEHAQERAGDDCIHDRVRHVQHGSFSIVESGLCLRSVLWGRVLLGWIEEPIVPGAFGRAANAADRTRLVIDDDLVVHKQRRSGGVDREFHQ